MNSLILIIVAIVSFLVGMGIALCIFGIVDVVFCNQAFAKTLRELRESELYLENKKLKEMLKNGDSNDK